MAQLFPLLCSFIGLMVIGSLVYGIYKVTIAETKRTEAMQSYAQQRGWAFEGFSAAMEQRLASFKVFSQGRNRVLKNVIRGAQESLSLSVGDYTYITGTGKSRTVHNQTVCMVRVEGMALPHFFLRRQMPLLDALGRLLGGQDVNFDDDPAFSKAYVLQSNSGEAAARQVFNERARNAFTTLISKSPQVEGNGDTLLIHFGRRLPFEEINVLIVDAVNVARLWTPTT